MSSQVIQGRVLVVDDNVEAAELFQMLLNLDGYDVRVVNNGVDALITAEQFLPHVVVTDLGMPGMSGIELARHLRGSFRSSNILLIAVSGWSDIDTHESVVSAGFDKRFSKPVPFEELSDYIRKFFLRATQHR